MTNSHWAGRPWSPVRSILVAGMLAGSAGCATTTPVQIDDSSASVRSARLVWRPDSPDPDRQRSGVEIDYASHRGSGAQTLASGERVVLDGVVVNGPQTLNHEVESEYVHVAYSVLFRTGLHAAAGDRIEWEALIGAGQVRLALRSQGSVPAAPEFVSRFTSSGVVLGIAPRWQFTEYVAAEARLTHMTNLDDSRDLKEIALTFRPIRFCVLRVGYSEASADFADNFGADKRVQTTLSGPFLGLTLDF